MYRIKHWNVLVVDDEEDVHDVTKLALKHETFFGARLRLHHAHSADEARKMLADKSGDIGSFQALNTHLVIALVDVVMETDTAGLDLCREIRQIPNDRVQLMLRTGQPGMAPARQVIDDYEIGDYLAKPEVTSERLYTVFKAAIRSYIATEMVLSVTWRMDALRETATSGDDAVAVYASLLEDVNRHGGEHAGYELDLALDFGSPHRYVGAGCFAEYGAYEGIKAGLLAKAAEQLEKHAYWGGVRHRWAKVGEDYVVQTRVVGTEDLATAVIRSPTVPQGLEARFAHVWRQELAGLAQIVMA